MFRSLPLFIGLRYIRAKKRNRFISIISAISFLGISLGVAVLITVMSVMNGFDEQIKNRILMMVPPLKVYELGGKLENWQGVAKQIESKIPKVQAAAPVIDSQGLLSADRGGSTTAFVQIQGIEPKYQTKVLPIAEHIIDGSLTALDDGKGYNIVLGSALADSLGVTIGDKVTLIVPKVNLTPAGMIPRIKQFTVSGVFSVSYQYDAYYAFINIKNAQKVFQLGENVSALQLGVNNVYDAPQIKNKLNDGAIESYYFTRDWTDENKSFFDALKMEKTMMFFILLLIITVAIFNLLSSLVMVVTDKRSDIAILRTMGMSSRQIITVFIYQGFIIGLIGTILGVLLGILLSSYATEIVNFIQHVTGKQLISANVYLIDYIPSKLMLEDVIKVTIVSMFLSFIATLYPAWSASRVQPVEALRYE
ncbi:lipoprotein-releasing ABC transporter permease subunit [Allofrancisella guangzhouensis]|uniref:Cell division protein FtsX n=1 Tax=Allofrancisella guangzhouensis TaxID=594679 RepID=A0A0A8E5P3_9GAMM|nr:lipoprotein-releasing ABC transporter permease subunit [Allofrancisella guangzhouensis]AJC49284.1 cell division protein FtsX [Allofrancisella guangzhouensis]MBK2027729.1 lipoprotein-releasing ABC transporter permease subunit [Allofrancisella guangzhouensis]MBK2043998.1 lipoprotein-releasing ABC transporter permease subunit [Allofrancisella guangzhouensis]MBK2046382.1 lipoprotein-releasing ABC transporter permease subunit [Allofrancisella guangzhouensis]